MNNNCYVYPTVPKFIADSTEYYTLNYNTKIKT